MKKLILLGILLSLAPGKLFAQHGAHVADVLRNRHQVECGFVCGDTLPFQRDETLRRATKRKVAR